MAESESRDEKWIENNRWKISQFAEMFILADKKTTVKSAIHFIEHQHGYKLVGILIRHFNNSAYDNDDKCIYYEYVLECVTELLKTDTAILKFIADKYDTLAVHQLYTKVGGDMFPEYADYGCFGGKNYPSSAVYSVHEKLQQTI
ncbi:MAG: hypothetical protein Faunusvirus44_3 [Faunusvirus sp.]|jgi:hypothetical protein|uniref:Uncharacterized protein n=1 Tax=Faunusvirus sp. TaxID=2487766 RepID=A0A3G5A1J7_9VIRU|nr:MAG: hypothetical protein Faunusvirus44_3 [Faunusvirus sp.]